jgi:cytochrome c oxidase cbb3-type subunit 3
MRIPLAVAALPMLLALASCEREKRRFTEPVARDLGAAIGATATADVGVPGWQPPYDRNAWAVSEGKRLYVWFNCVGCHAMGGGGMGPPLLDDRWRYGAAPEDVFSSIVDGRPNGMPAFRGKIPDPSIWQLVAYVRSMSGQLPLDVPSSRGENISAGNAESMRPRAVPRREEVEEP